jgi:aminoglycoside phosphotransferase (APT) family kinase protein
MRGGYSGESFAARVGAEEVVVRIFAGRASRRDAQGRFLARPAEVEGAVLGLLLGLFPVPRVLELRRPDPAADLPAMLVTERLPGIDGQSYYDGADAEQRARLGDRLGGILAELAGIPMLRAGWFADAELTIVDFAEAAADLKGWAEYHLGESRPGLLARLSGLITSAQDRLDGARRSCLAHGDFNLKNLLVDPVSGELTGIVDWEFVHAGHPATDLGNLLRGCTLPPDEPFATAVLDRYRARYGGSREEVRATAADADLFALIELAGRAPREPGNRPAQAAEAHLLRRLDQIGDGGIS